MLAVLLIVGGLIPQIHAGAFTIRILSADDNVITGRFLDSLLLSFPPCSFADQNVDLEYTNCNTSKNYTLDNIFTVPKCDNEDNRYGPPAHRMNIGYKLNNLTSGTQYKINYKIGNSKSNTVTATTRTANDYAKIGLGFPGRSAAMVVIVVILSVAAFILLISILVGLFASPCRD
ncbi:uncharacterized protein upk2 [Neoarius graeffei]|uniref:uncharacterized protein upk2 n=1 Tax=Neoarius graeffei TaxID=443677 RepID=UPI00298C4D03|nr:uncharacterized protein upk2 [Neoarius graeffei]